MPSRLHEEPWPLIPLGVGAGDRQLPSLDRKLLGFCSRRRRHHRSLLSAGQRAPSFALSTRTHTTHARVLGSHRGYWEKMHVLAVRLQLKLKTNTFRIDGVCVLTLTITCLSHQLFLSSKFTRKTKQQLQSFAIRSWPYKERHFKYSESLVWVGMRMGAVTAPTAERVSNGTGTAEQAAPQRLRTCVAAPFSIVKICCLFLCRWRFDSLVAAPLSGGQVAWILQACGLGYFRVHGITGLIPATRVLPNAV